MGRFPIELKEIEAALARRPAVAVTDVMGTMYSFLYPETREAIDELWAARPMELYERAFDGVQEQLPPIMLRRWRAWSRMGLGGFTNGYVTAGASEALKDLILPGIRVHFFQGDYGGFHKIADARGVPWTSHPRGSLPTQRLTSGDVWFVTDPSSIDGDHWDGLDNWLVALRAHSPLARVVIDATYVGAVWDYRPRSFTEHPNVTAVVFSLSKPFGVYFHRIGGIVSRVEIPSLYGNRWFNNPFSIMLATLMMGRYSVDELPRKYAPLQASVVERAIQRGHLPFSARPANVIMLAIAPEGPASTARAPGIWRHTLTPGMYRKIYPEENA